MPAKHIFKNGEDVAGMTFEESHQEPGFPYLAICQNAETLHRWAAVK